jgi:phage FluMu gp28-like protein
VKPGKPAELPGDVLRVLSWEEFPASVREIPSDLDPLAEGVLMKHQREWIAFIHAHDLSVCPKGRRTGITYATALDDAITAASNKMAGGDNVYYIGDTQEKGLEFIGYCAHMSRVMVSAMAPGWRGVEVFLFEDQLPDGGTRQITSYRIRYASGFQIVALSSNPANIRGLQGIVNIDEAAFHPNVQAVIDAVTALLIWGGKIRIISSHNGDKNPFNQLVVEARAGRNAFKVYEVTFNDAVANGLYERVCLMKGTAPTAEGKRLWYEKIRGAYTNREAMLEELDAVPRQGSGVAIPTVLIEACMREPRPIVRLVLDTAFAAKGLAYREAWAADWIRQQLNPALELLRKDRVHVFGEDYARHRDFAVTAPASIESDLTRRVPFLLEMQGVPARQQEQILWHLIDHLPNLRAGAMDAGGNGATLAEYTADKYGIERIFQVMLTDAWYRDNMGPFTSAFEDRSIDLPRDADVRSDLQALQKVDGITKLPKLRLADNKDPNLVRHGDAAIALALMWFASSADVLDTAILSAGSRESATLLRGYR